MKTITMFVLCLTKEKDMQKSRKEVMTRPIILAGCLVGASLLAAVGAVAQGAPAKDSCDVGGSYCFSFRRA